MTMGKMKSLDELRRIRAKAEKETLLRTTGENPDRTVLAVGMATCGIAAGAREVMGALIAAVEENALKDISVMATGCFGFCYAEPVVEVRMPNRPPVMYGHVTTDMARRIIDEHVLKGQLIDHAVIGQEVGRI